MRGKTGPTARVSRIDLGEAAISQRDPRVAGDREGREAARLGIDVDQEHGVGPALPALAIVEAQHQDVDVALAAEWLPDRPDHRQRRAVQ